MSCSAFEGLRHKSTHVQDLYNNEKVFKYKTLIDTRLIYSNKKYLKKKKKRKKKV